MRHIPIKAQDALAKVQQTDSPVLFIDVRDPVEIMFVGFTDAVHANIPFMLVDCTRWNADKGLVVEPHKRHAQPNGWQNSGLPWSAMDEPSQDPSHRPEVITVRAASPVAATSPGPGPA